MRFKEADPHCPTCYSSQRNMDRDPLYNPGSGNWDQWPHGKGNYGCPDPWHDEPAALQQIEGER